MAPPTRFTDLEQFRIFDNQDDLDKCRLNAYNAFIKRNFTTQQLREGQKHFLTANEDRLFVRYHETLLLKQYRGFQPSMSYDVMETAFAMFKRFFVNNTAMEFHPMDILTAAIYVANDVEGARLPLHQFKRNFDNGERAVGAALANQDVLLDKLGGGMRSYNPLKIAKKLFLDIRTQEKMDASELFWPRVSHFLTNSFLTDALLLYSPQKIALASNVEAASMSDVDMDHYIARVLCKECPEEIPSAIQATLSVRQLVRAYKPPHKNEIGPIRLKLKKIWASATNSKSYERNIKKKFDAVKAAEPWTLDENIVPPDEKDPWPRTKIYFDRRYL